MDNDLECCRSACGFAKRATKLYLAAGTVAAGFATVFWQILNNAGAVPYLNGYIFTIVDKVMLTLGSSVLLWGMLCKTYFDLFGDIKLGAAALSRLAVLDVADKDSFEALQASLRQKGYLNFSELNLFLQSEQQKRDVERGCSESAAASVLNRSLP